MNVDVATTERRPETSGAPKIGHTVYLDFGSGELYVLRTTNERLRAALVDVLARLAPHEIEIARKADPAKPRLWKRWEVLRSNLVAVAKVRAQNDA